MASLNQREGLPARKIRVNSIGLFIVVAAVFFVSAIRSCQQHPNDSTQIREIVLPEIIAIKSNYSNTDTTTTSTYTQRRNLRSMNFIDRRNPDDLKKLHHKSGIYIDPSTTTSRQQNPLTADNYKINPLVKPDGYPWHRWAKQKQEQPDDYPLNTQKFVQILARLGNGENQLGDVTPQNYTQNGVPITEDTVRMHGMVRPYIIRGGTVLRPEGRTGMFVTLVQRAVELAGSLKDQDAKMRAL